jgi:hypothetical protein
VPASPSLFLCDSPARRDAVARVARRLPELRGEAIRIHDVPGLRDRRGPVHAGSFLRERRIAFDCARAEFPRIFVHELFHFAWVRLGNPRRRSWEEVLQRELETGARGEWGWSAEWRKRDLAQGDGAARTRRWREYACESFCDTAARLYSGLGRHGEFTLSERFGQRRRQWFAVQGAAGLSI